MVKIGPSLNCSAVMTTERHRNFVPSSCRCVSVQLYDGPMTVQAINARFLGREAYRRTEYIVLRGGDGSYAVIAVTTKDRNPLFSPIENIEVLALPQDCVYLRDPETDVTNASSLGSLAYRNGIAESSTLICEGRFDHVSFICHPNPIILTVVEVVPPDPPKLFTLVQQVLAYANLSPIVPILEKIDITELTRNVTAECFLAPCRSGGLDHLGAPVYYLDERPPQRLNWTLIGCERSLQFHRHYYGDVPPRIEICPKRLAGVRTDPTIMKCCLLEFDFEREENVIQVPWGASLATIEKALKELCDATS